MSKIPLVLFFKRISYFHFIKTCLQTDLFHYSNIQGSKQAWDRGLKSIFSHYSKYILLLVITLLVDFPGVKRPKGQTAWENPPEATWIYGKALGFFLASKTGSVIILLPKINFVCMFTKNRKKTKTRMPITLNSTWLKVVLQFICGSMFYKEKTPNRNILMAKETCTVLQLNFYTVHC